MLYRQETPMSSMITRNRVTNSPDSTEGVMLMNSWLGLEGPWVTVWVVVWVAARMRTGDFYLVK